MTISKRSSAILLCLFVVSVAFAEPLKKEIVVACRKSVWATLPENIKDRVTAFLFTFCPTNSTEGRGGLPVSTWYFAPDTNIEVWVVGPYWSDHLRGNASRDKITRAKWDAATNNLEGIDIFVEDTDNASQWLTDHQFIQIQGEIE